MVLEKGSSVLALALLNPVSVNAESTSVDYLGKTIRVIMAGKRVKKSLETLTLRTAFIR